MSRNRIPPEDYENFLLVGQEGKYHVESLCWDDGDLTVYQIISDEGKRLQAQQFDLCPLPKNLYSSRKRRIYRLRKAQKIVEIIELDGVKVLVTPVPENPTEGQQGSPKYEEKETTIGR
jgi:diphthamide synthase subunit DPH2